MKHETIEPIIATLKFISGIGSLSFFALWQFGVVQSSIHFNQILKGWREGNGKFQLYVQQDSKRLWLMENSNKMILSSFVLSVINIILNLLSK